MGLECNSNGELDARPALPQRPANRRKRLPCQTGRTCTVGCVIPTLVQALQQRGVDALVLVGAEHHNQR